MPATGGRAVAGQQLLNVSQPARSRDPLLAQD